MVICQKRMFCTRDVQSDGIVGMLILLAKYHVDPSQIKNSLDHKKTVLITTLSSNYHVCVWYTAFGYSIMSEYV